MGLRIDTPKCPHKTQISCGDQIRSLGGTTSGPGLTHPQAARRSRAETLPDYAPARITKDSVPTAHELLYIIRCHSSARLGVRTGPSMQTMTTSDLQQGSKGDDRGPRFGSAAAAMVGVTFDQLPYPAFIYDNVSTIVAVNQAGQRLLHSSSGKVAGRPCSEVFHCRTCDRECGVLAGLSQQQVAAEHSVRIATSAGREYLACVKLSNLTDDAGAIQGVLAMFTSVIDAPLNQRQSIVAESRVMREVLCFARRVAASEASSILVEGDSGTGKELVAKLLHDESRRSAHPFIAINCAAMPETLLESELFGYERGAFTDARAPKRGLFELANKGTLFLDEIGELPLRVQAKLLRVLDDRTFRTRHLA